MFIDSSIDLDSSLASLELSGKTGFVYSALGFHPFSGENFSPAIIDEYSKLIDSNRKVVAIGEIGLDFKAGISLKEQEDILAAFLKLAKSKDLPVIIHNRRQDEKILDVLDRYFTSYSKVILHCFSYGEDFLAKVVERGGFVSFSLNILRKKGKVIRALKHCPRDNLLLETDSPYMRIEGEPSTPRDISQTYSVAAEVKNIDRQDLEAIISANAKGLFSLG